MGSSSKRRQTFSKMTRERAVKEKREAKQEKKEERKRAAAEAAALEASGGVPADAELTDAEPGEAGEVEAVDPADDGEPEAH